MPEIDTEDAHVVYSWAKNRDEEVLARMRRRAGA